MGRRSLAHGTFVPARSGAGLHDGLMNTKQTVRGALLFVEAFVAVTSILGGIGLVVGSFLPDGSLAVSPPLAYLDGSPFTSYLVPGLVLAVVVGGLHAIAFAMLLRDRPASLLYGTAAGYAVLVWIFVQMTVIPFSVLQAVYFLAGAVELGLVMLLLGLLPLPSASASSARAMSSVRGGAAEASRRR